MGEFMSKKLYEMTLEELWKLFPIFLTEYNDKWSIWFEEEKNILCSIIPGNMIKRISHIGSTAVRKIWAKPIVDILIEIYSEYDFDTIKRILKDNLYICMAESDGRLSFNKGYTEKGFAEKVYHIHIRYEGDNDELYFRDYINENKDIAKEYEKLKLELWKKFEYNRDEYTERKSEFVEKHTRIAKDRYRGRY